MANLFDQIPAQLPEELFEPLLTSEQIRIERILSYGHHSPAQEWYDQNENEWVLVLEGYGVIEFESGDTVTLGPGDYLLLPPHCKHRVSATKPDGVTIWLAIFYPG